MPVEDALDYDTSSIALVLVYVITPNIADAVDASVPMMRSLSGGMQALN